MSVCYFHIRPFTDAGLIPRMSDWDEPEEPTSGSFLIWDGATPVHCEYQKRAMVHENFKLQKQRRFPAYGLISASLKRLTPCPVHYQFVTNVNESQRASLCLVTYTRMVWSSCREGRLFLVLGWRKVFCWRVSGGGSVGHEGVDG